MAVVTIAMNGDATTAVHPFFAKPTGHNYHSDQDVTKFDCKNEEKAEGPSLGQVDACLDGTSESTTKKGGRRKANAQKIIGTMKGQKTLSQVLNLESTIVAQHESQVSKEPQGSLSQDEVEVDSGRRKRRRMNKKQATGIDGFGDDTSPAMTSSPPVSADNVVNETDTTSPVVLIPRSSPPEMKPGSTASDTDLTLPDITMPETPPKKMLKLNASGRFSSPVSKVAKDNAQDTTTQQPKRRGRPRRSKEAEISKHLVVCMHYGTGDATVRRATIGLKIDEVLSGQVTVPITMSTRKKPQTPRKPAKSTHPFFIGKPNAPQPPKRESPRRTSAITPGKLRSQTLIDRPEPAKDLPFVMTSALLRDRLMVKHPGMCEPPWPTKETAHVHGSNDIACPRMSFVFRIRKQKQARRPIEQRESILNSCAKHLKPEQPLKLRSDGFYEPHQSLRIPERLLISGQEIGSHAAHEMSVSPGPGLADELSSAPALHPVLAKTFKEISGHMSAYDNLRGESSSWIQKSSPNTTEDVLQPNNEMMILKTWLQSHTINAVDATIHTTNQAQVKPAPKPRKRRRPKNDELDDFIVDENDDLHSMSARSDDGVTDASGVVKSIVQTHLQGTKSSNAILLSGPHGCGKTAAVHAVAKELNFKVFEISSSERRSGKDVLEKIGDVTENHIVRHHGGTITVEGSNVETDRIDAAFQTDLDSGRQGKMDGFFKPKATPKVTQAKPKANISSGPARPKAIEALQNVLKKPAREQQQSLILLEEVDVLFKEDREFWSTVLKLLATSKRPFILTCNDEDLVPIQAISLHAILRFSPPTADLAIDYLLLLAAKEGHLLKRNAIKQLWDISEHDLRRSIMTLDFWCRMGVGDVKSGLGWIYQRWPPDSDLDAHGNKIRVVSRGTYEASMGMVVQSADTVEQMKSAAIEFGVDPSSCLGWHTLNLNLPAVSESNVHNKDRIEALRHLDVFTDSLSAIDIFSQSYNIDLTLPDLPDKQRNLFIEGMQLLDAKEITDITGLSLELEITATLSAFRTFAPDQVITSNNHPSSQAPPRLERRDFASFDALANVISSHLSTASTVDTSVIDGPFSTLVTDVAPYVRQVVRHDMILEEQRNAIAGPGKRARKTRAARSALEGGQRQLTRRERWWEGLGDLRGVLRTGGTGWEALSSVEREPDDGSAVEGDELGLDL